MMWFRIVFKIPAMYKSYNCLVMLCAESRRTVPAHRLFLYRVLTPFWLSAHDTMFLSYVLHITCYTNGKQISVLYVDNKILNLEALWEGLQSWNTLWKNETINLSSHLCKLLHQFLSLSKSFLIVYHLSCTVLTGLAGRWNWGCSTTSQTPWQHVLWRPPTNAIRCHGDESSQHHCKHTFWF